MTSQHKKNNLLSFTWQHVERSLIHINKLGHNDPQLFHYSNIPPSNANLKGLNNVKFFCFITRCRKFYSFFFCLLFRFPAFVVFNIFSMCYLWNSTILFPNFHIESNGHFGPTFCAFFPLVHLKSYVSWVHELWYH